MNNYLLLLSLMMITTNAFQPLVLRNNFQHTNKYTFLYSKNNTGSLGDYSEWLGFPREEWGKSLRVSVYALAFGALTHDVFEKLTHSGNEINF